GVDHIWQFWWLIFPIAGIVGSWFKGVQKWDEKRRRDRIELARIKYGQPAAPAAAPADAQAPHTPAPAQETTAAEIERLLAEEQEITRRWLDYELDAATLIDYPVITDM